jgi:HSP20 family molecular chaperone IbpA
MIVTESDGSRKFHLAFDIRGFEPEEVKIKTQNGTLIVSAKKEKKVRIQLLAPDLYLLFFCVGW